MTSQVQILKTPRGWVSLGVTGAKPNGCLGSTHSLHLMGFLLLPTIPKFSILVCNCLFWLFFLDPSCALRKGMGIIITGESQQWSPQAVLEPVQRELTLPFAAGAPEKAADPFCLFFFFFKVAAFRRK